MPKYLFPTKMVNSVFEIDFDNFWENGIKGLIIDIDNTLAPFDSPLASDDVLNLLNKLTEKGFLICLLSNNSQKRVEIFSKDLNYPHIWKAKKPSTKGIDEALKLLGLSKDEVILIGDQIFTDVLAGSRAGVDTILTKPMSDTQDEWQVKLKRYPEKVVLRLYEKSKS